MKQKMSSILTFALCILLLIIMLHVIFVNHAAQRETSEGVEETGQVEMEVYKIYKI